MIKQIRLPLRGRPILLITRLLTERIGLLSVMLPLLIKKKKRINLRQTFNPQTDKIKNFVKKEMGIRENMTQNNPLIKFMQL